MILISRLIDKPDTQKYHVGASSVLGRTVKPLSNAYYELCRVANPVAFGLMDGSDSNLLEAFHQVVWLFPDWSAAQPEPLVSIRQQSYSMGMICRLTQGNADPLPEEVLRKIRGNMDADDGDLKEQIGRDPSYGSGADCMLTLIARCKAYDERLEELRRDKGLIDP
jgi:hypothetical protein